MAQSEIEQAYARAQRVFFPPWEQFLAGFRPAFDHYLKDNKLHVPAELYKTMAAVAVDIYEHRFLALPQIGSGRVNANLTFYNHRIRQGAEPDVALDATLRTIISAFLYYLKLLPPMSETRQPFVLPAWELIPNLWSVDQKLVSFFQNYHGFAYNYGRVDRERPYGSDTPLRPLYYVDIPFGFDTGSRLAHQMIVAPSDHGKTQLLELQILSDLHQPNPPGMVIIDSKGTMVERIARLALFNDKLKDRIIFVDPREEPALNLFDMGGVTDKEVSNRIVNQLSYFFRALMGDDLSNTMSGVFLPLAQLLRHIPGANLTTLLEAIDDVHAPQFAEAMSKVPPDLRRYFDRDYKELSGKESKNAIKRRIYRIKQSSTVFDAMFSARSNKLDMADALNTGKIVLVSTEKSFLEDLSPVFGRYIIFRVIAAALQRSTIPPDQRRPAYLYVDEAGPYIDEKTEELFSTLREYGLGAIMAFQYLGQTKEYVKTILTNTTIKMIGGKNFEDAKLLAPYMEGVDDEFIMAQGRDKHPPKWAKFATYVRNSMRTLSLTIPIGTIKSERPMTEEQYQVFRAENRKRLADDPIVDRPIEVAPDPIRDSDLRLKPREERPRRASKDDVDIKPTKDW